MKKGTQQAPDFLCCKGNPELVAVFSKERGVGVWGKFSIEKKLQGKRKWISDAVAAFFVMFATIQ